ncbi:hypothetical protein GCM10010151_37850 [Actinoallomurus spadix]|uniref:Uncharacterized protein n=1 Tax=Actinoallomurus spadix TaxID=79912 RepID=A0ABP3GJ39_9ACTN
MKITARVFLEDNVVKIGTCDDSLTLCPSCPKSPGRTDERKRRHDGTAAGATPPWEAETDGEVDIRQTTPRALTRLSSERGVPVWGVARPATSAVRSGPPWSTWRTGPE